MNRHSLLFFILIFSISCQKKLVIQKFNIANKKEFSQKPFDKKLSKCNKWESYVPDSLHKDWNYMRTVRINMLVVHDSTGLHNYKDGEAQVYLSGLVHNANERLLQNFKMNLPVGNYTPAINPYLQWKITSSKGFEKNKGIYFIKENQIDAFYINHGRGQNNYKRAVTDRNLIGSDSILNVFIMSHPPDSLSSKTFKKKTAGIALGKAIKLGGLYHKNKENWMHATLLNHEIGHIFSLGHAWHEDGCPDTPNNPNCYSVTGEAPCDSIISNNLMDYNNSQMAITPCQIGRMHLVIARDDSEQRKFIVKDWCHHDTSKQIVIGDHVAWEGARDLSHSILVKSGASLKLCCRLSMPSGSSITLEPGAKLILEEIKVHNDCGETWQGIIMQHKGKMKSTVELIGNAVILDVAINEIEVD